MMPLANTLLIEIFARHVANICTDVVGSDYTLIFDRDLEVQIEIRSEHEVYVNGFDVGYRYGAVKEYTQLVKEYLLAKEGAWTRLDALRCAWRRLVALGCAWRWRLAALGRDRQFRTTTDNSRQTGHFYASGLPMPAIPAMTLDR